MKTVLIIIFSVFLVLLQLTFAPRLEIFGALPNLILAFSVAWAIYKEGQKSSWLVLIPALLLDLLIGRPFGLFTLSLWLSFSLVRWLGRSLFKQSGFVSLLVLAVSGVLFYRAAFKGLAKLAAFFNLNGALPINWSDFYLNPFLPMAALYDVLLCLLIFLLIKKFHHRWLRLVWPASQPAIYKR